MRYQRCSVLLFTTILAFGNLRNYGNAADNRNNGSADEELDASEFDSDDTISSFHSLKELAQLEQRMRNMTGQKAGADEQFDVGDDDEPEDESNTDAGTGPPVEELDLFEELDANDLEGADEEEQGENIEETTPKDTGGIFVDGSLGDLQVQTQDEEGVKLDTSSLSHDNEAVSPTISTFVDAPPKFKKEEEDKRKRKEEAKERKKNNNDIHEYETEIRTFLEAKEKNKERFKEGIENAEVEMQAPKKPSWWKRLKHWYETRMNELNERYASENVD